MSLIPCSIDMNTSNEVLPFILYNHPSPIKSEAKKSNVNIQSRYQIMMVSDRNSMRIYT